MDVGKDLRELGQLLSDAVPVPRLRTVTSEPSKVDTPGCWLRFDRVRHNILDGGYELDVTAHLVVPEQEVWRAHDQLSALFTDLQPTLERVGYTGDGIAFVGLILPGSSTPLPALAVPLTLTIEPDTEE